MDCCDSMSLNSHVHFSEALLQPFRWKKSQIERSDMSYCRKHFLNRTALITIEVTTSSHILGCETHPSVLNLPVLTLSSLPSPSQDIKQELMKMMEQAGFSSPRSSSKSQPPPPLSKQQISVLNAALTAGLYDSVARVLCTPSVDVLERVACTVETPQGKAQVHQSSVNRHLQTHGWLLYQEKVRNRVGSARACRMGSDLSLTAGNSRAGEVHQDLPARHHSGPAFPPAAVWRRHRHTAPGETHNTGRLDSLPGQSFPLFLFCCWLLLFLIRCCSTKVLFTQTLASMKMQIYFCGSDLCSHKASVLLKSHFFLRICLKTSSSCLDSSNR